MERDIYSEKIQVEKKLLTFNLKENPRGRFLRVTEDVGGRRDTIIIPACGLELVREILARAIHADKNAKAPTEHAL